MIELFKTKKNSKEKPIQPDEWPKHVETLNHASFDKFINKYPLSVIDFWAPWCKPCKTMLPRLRRLERLYVGKVAFGRVDTQIEKDIAKKYNIMGIPHFGFFHYISTKRYLFFNRKIIYFSSILVYICLLIQFGYSLVRKYYLIARLNFE